MPELSLSQVANQSAYVAGDVVANTAKVVGDLACSLYSLYPGALIPNPGSTLLVGFWDSLCAKKVRAPDKDASATGGKCVGTIYNITATWDEYSAAGAYTATINLNAVAVRGPIKRIFVTQDATAYGSAAPGVVILGTNTDGSNQVKISTAGYAGGFLARDLRSIVITPTSGPNNCGDVAGGYPNTSIPSGALTKTDLWPSINGIAIPVSITLNSNVTTFPLVFTIGGNTIKLDMSGLNITFGNGANPIPSIADIISALNQAINNSILTPPTVPTTGTGGTHNLTPNPSGAGQGGGQDNISALDYVEITLTTISPSADILFGVGGSPNVYLGAGWIEFLSNSYSTPRTPIQFINNWFKCPDGCTSYKFTLARGYQATSAAYSRKQV